MGISVHKGIAAAVVRRRCCRLPMDKVGWDGSWCMSSRLVVLLSAIMMLYSGHSCLQRLYFAPVSPQRSKRMQRLQDSVTEERFHAARRDCQKRRTPRDRPTAGLHFYLGEAPGWHAKPSPAEDNVPSNPGGRGWSLGKQ